MTFLLEIARLGLGNLRLHMLRSILTSLGIILGVAAVIVMVAIGEGNKQAALRNIEALGANNIIIRSTKPPESTAMGANTSSFVARYGITREDLRRIKANFPDAVHIVALKAVGDEMIHKDKRLVSSAFGVTPDFAKAANITVREGKGRYITQADEDTSAAVAVIGSSIAQKFFPLEDPIGQTFRIKDQVFRVVGVMNPVGFAGGAGSPLVGRDLNDDVHIPMSAAETRFGDFVQRRVSGSFINEDVQLHEIYITSASTETVMRDAQRVRAILRAGHPDLTDVKLIVPWELVERAKRAALLGNIVLIAIAAISLIVGGIGIMNIMLASVTERTREIGIRRALGATRRDIVAQFLVETGSLSAIGGLLGIALGVGLAIGLEFFVSLSFVQALFDTPVQLETDITPWSIGVSFVVGAGVGLVFGIYPAIIASRQDPIVALRHD